MKYDFAMENCLGTDYPNLHELNKNCYAFSPASVQNGPQAAAAAAAADEQTMYKVKDNFIRKALRTCARPTTVTADPGDRLVCLPAYQPNYSRLHCP
jgi:ribosomal protein S27AE